MQTFIPFIRERSPIGMILKTAEELKREEQNLSRSKSIRKSKKKFDQSEKAYLAKILKK